MKEQPEKRRSGAVLEGAITDGGWAPASIITRIVFWVFLKHMIKVFSFFKNTNECVRNRLLLVVQWKDILPTLMQILFSTQNIILAGSW